MTPDQANTIEGPTTHPSDAEMVTLVDRDDNQTGVAQKLAVHRDGQLHRACSVFVFDADGRALLQRRARTKYHSGGLWSNTCCGHPKPGEQALDAARRRLREEMGFECDLHYVGSVYYSLELPDKLYEHELDHVFVGRFDGRVSPNPDEVEEIRWTTMARLRRDLDDCPDSYTPWIGVILKEIVPSAPCGNVRPTPEHATRRAVASPRETRLPLTRDSGLQSTLLRSLGRLQELQYRSDGPDFYKGEFPMRLSGRVTRQDHNFLSGYALLHVALARTSPALPHACRCALESMLDIGRHVPERYANSDGLGNWYHGKKSRCAAPPDFDWHRGVVLCLKNDADDTSVAAQIRCVCGVDFDRSAMISRFGSTALRRGEAASLGYRSQRRLEIADVDAGVYQTWFLPGPDPEMVRRTAALRLPVKMVPDINSVELVTASNIWTAVRLLGGDDNLQESQRATRAFVNRLARSALSGALHGDAGLLTYAAPYYPWVPFAPLAFIVRNHCVSGSVLLEPSTLDAIVEALQQSDLWRGEADAAFPGLAYSLNCAGWCALAGHLPSSALPMLVERWAALTRYVDSSGRWPDFIFFNEAHIGDYGGSAYSQAMMVETMALLRNVLA